MLLLLFFLQAAGTGLATLAKSNKLGNVAVAFLKAPEGPTATAAARGLALGALLGGYESTRFKSKPKNGGKMKSLCLLAVEGAEAGVKEATAVASGNLLTR